jgi:hypothetical protein
MVPKDTIWLSPFNFKHSSDKLKKKNKKTQRKIVKHIGCTTWNTSTRKRPTCPNQQSLYRIQSNRKKEKERNKSKRKELSFTEGRNARAKIGEVGDRVFSYVEVIVPQQLSHLTACSGCEQTSMENGRWCRGGWASFGGRSERR